MKNWFSKSSENQHDFTGLDVVQLQYEQYADTCDKETKELVNSMSKELQVS